MRVKSRACAEPDSPWGRLGRPLHRGAVQGAQEHQSHCPGAIKSPREAIQQRRLGKLVVHLAGDAPGCVWSEGQA